MRWNPDKKQRTLPKLARIMLTAAGQVYDPECHNLSGVFGRFSKLERVTDLIEG